MLSLLLICTCDNGAYYQTVFGSVTDLISLLILLLFFTSSSRWSDLFKLKSPSFQIGSGWNLARMFLKYR